jgi:hypothetical protein
MQEAGDGFHEARAESLAGRHGSRESSSNEVLNLVYYSNSQQSR